MSFLNDCSTRISQLRNEKRWTKKKLADKVKVHPSHISRIESGDTIMSLDALSKIITALGTDPSTFFGNEIFHYSTPNNA